MRYLIVLFFLIVVAPVYSQMRINGPYSVSPYGANEQYGVQNAPTGAQLTWTCSGGTVITPGGDGCIIQWDEGFFIGAITVTEDFYGEVASIYVMVGGPNITPSEQYVVYGEPAETMCVNASYAESYQWQRQTVSGTWENVPNANQSCYLPPHPAAGTTVNYRCEMVIYGVHFSAAATVTKPPFSGGIISLTQSVAYNSIPVINAQPAIGGECHPSTYQYTWELSVEGGPWIQIGNTAAFPTTNVPPIIGSTRIRRKVVCAGETIYSNTLIVKPVYTSVDAENRNYIRTYTVTTKGLESWYQADQAETGKKFQNTVYFDGIGRPVQTVDKGVSSGSSNSWNDLVSFTQYDNLGRSTHNYLPYPTASEPGKFKTNTNEQATFYSTNYNESSPWGRTDLESNPLNRVFKAIDPGNYRLANNIGTSFNYDFNNANGVDEKVHIWRIGYTLGALPVSSATDVYQTGTLIRTTTADDKGKKVIEYKDFRGNVILKKVQLKETTTGLTNEHGGWLCTYNVYDDFNQLRFIITPKAVAYLDANNWVLNQSIADELCYYFEYDNRGRVINKKTPGAAKLSMVYDERDRLVFTQDGNQFNKSPKEWLVNFYDELNRISSTGIFKSDKTRDQLQIEVDNAVVSGTFTVPGGQAIVDLIVPPRTTNLPLRYAARNSIDFGSEFESLLNDEFLAEIDPYASVSSQSVPLTVNAPLPVNVNDAVTFTALSYHYYDNYNYPDAKAFDNNFNNHQAYTSSEPNVEAISKTARTLSMPTGSKVRVLGTNTFLTTTIYYDEKGLAVQTLGDNFKQGVDVVTNQYHFDGRIMSTYTRHRASGSGFNDFGILTKNEFDKIGRLQVLQKKYGTANFKKIASYQYDQFGRLQNKKLGKKPNTADDPLETINYSYNANGILTGINKDYALSPNNSDQWNNYFGLHLGYENFDSRFANARFDHLITGVIWKTQGDNTPRKYDFTYDNAGRFTGANFTQKTSPSETVWSNTKVDFSENNIVYDENGNLKQLDRKGILPGNSSALYIDKLTYHYKQVAGSEWSNQLLKVFDNNPAIGATGNGKLGDFKDEVFNSNSDDYVYDANGNLVIDNNKKIRNGSGNGLIYNFLDKPEKIILENKSTVEFTYDALGTKLAKKVTPVNGTARTTYYIGEFIYEGDALQFILNEEGRVRVMTPVNSSTPLGAAGMTVNGNVQLTTDKWGVFDYFIKDHLGSTRLVITEEYHREIYNCTMENAAAPEEERIFGRVDNNGNPQAGNEVVSTRSANNNWSNNPSAQVSKLITTTSSNTRSIGPNVLLKVMGGDLISTTTKYYYDVPPSNVTNGSILSTIVSSIIGGFTGGDINQAVKDGAVPLQNSLQDPGVSPLLGFLHNRPASLPDRPKAYLNYIFFDENFNYVFEGSGAKLVNPQDNDDQLTAPNIRVAKNGYVYVYLSNESDWTVSFDDFIVTHERGAIIEETHYYPHGLKIAGISSRAFNKLPNKYGFQGEYSEKEEETGYDEFELRIYDPQTGRWIQQDPYDEFASGYVGMGNDPVNNVDPNGGVIGPFEAGFLNHMMWTAAGSIAGAVISGAASGWDGQAMKNGAVTGGAIGLGVSFVPWDVVGKAIWQGGRWFGNEFAAFFQSNGGWNDLLKSTLAQYYMETYKVKDPTNQDLGTEFETIFFDYVLKNPTLFFEYKIRPNGEKFVGGDRNTVPDFMGSTFVYQLRNGRGKKIEILRSAWFELKAKDKGLYLSSNSGQVRGHIDNLDREYRELKRKYRGERFKPKLYLITTADVPHSASISDHATLMGVGYEHIHAEYKKTGKKWHFRFSKSIYVY